MDDRSRYHSSSSKRKLQASCSRCFNRCPTCSSSLDKDDAEAIASDYESDLSDKSSKIGSENFLTNWDRHLSILSIKASLCHKQAIFGLRHAIEEINISRRRSSNLSCRECKEEEPVSPRMNRILEFMSENDMPSYSDPALGRLYEYLDIKASKISRDKSVRPPGSSFEEDMVPEVECNLPAIDPRCPICLEDLLLGQQVKELQCKHRFHVKCVERHFSWQKEKWCPVCTYNVRKERSNGNGVRRDWRRFWVCFRGPFSRIIARNSPSSSPADNNSQERND